MASIIEIKDKKGDDVQILAVELSHVIKLLEKEGSNLLWSILDLYTMGYKEENQEMLSIEQRLELSSEGDGIPVSWSALFSLASSCKQIIDTVIVGYKNPTYQPKLSTEHPIKELYKECEIVLELIDSSLWSIYAQDDEIIQRFKDNFHDIEILHAEDIP